MLVLRSDSHSSQNSWKVRQGIFPNKSKNWRSYKGGKIYAFCIVTTIGIKYLRTAILLSWWDAHTSGSPTALGTRTCSLTVAHRATTRTRYFQVLYKHGLRPIVSWCSMQFLWRSLRNFIYCISHIYLYIETAKNSIMLSHICTYEDLQTVNNHVHMRILIIW